METEPMTDPGTLDTQPMRIADITGGAAARRGPVSDQTDIDRERGAVDYPSAVDSQSEEALAPLFEQSALQDFRSRWACPEGFEAPAVETISHLAPHGGEVAGGSGALARREGA